MEGGRLLSVSGDGEVEDGMILLASAFVFCWVLIGCTQGSGTRT